MKFNNMILENSNDKILIDALKEIIDEANNHLNKMVEKFDVYSSEVKELKHELYNYIGAAGQKNKELESDIEDLRVELANINNLVKTHQEYITKQQIEISSFQKICSFIKSTAGVVYTVLAGLVGIAIWYLQHIGQ